MTPQDTKNTLIAYLNLKVSQEDWRGVAETACELRSLSSASASTAPTSVALTTTKPAVHPPASAAPPVQLEIPHHVNEVLSLLRMDDESLVDKMFPDYSQMPQEKES